MWTMSVDPFMGGEVSFLARVEVDAEEPLPQQVEWLIRWTARSGSGTR
ncbi:MAG: hypothetical protein ACP5K1_05740 [Candidatus Bathyarchaeia archaeon]